jgi:general secretion pathway protein G
MNERRRSRERAGQRGSTLVEVLIVVAIMATLAGMVTILAFPELIKARIRTAAMGAKAVRQAAQIYREVDMGGDASACPTLPALLQAKKLDATRSDDPWGSRYDVACEGDDLHGVSAGRDRKPGTADDVRDDITPQDVERIAAR